MGDFPVEMFDSPPDRHIAAHTRSYSTSNITVNPRKRKNSTRVLHHLLSTNTRRLDLAAPPVVNLTRVDSASLASFTPYSESIDSQGPAWGSLRAHMHVRSQSLSLIPKSEASAGQITDMADVWMPEPRQRPRVLSLFEVGPTAAYQPASPITLDEESPDAFSNSPPSSPSMSIPSISRTHSTTTSSSLPRTPPLPLSPLSPLSARRKKTKINREKLPDNGGRKRAPSLPVPPVHRNHDPSPWHDRVRERALSASDRSTTARLDRITTARSRSPLRTPDTLRSSSPTSPKSLAALESSSKLMRTCTTCTVCGASGPDFPRCPKCGDAWCSRICRMTARKEAGGGGDGVRGHGCKGARII